jgi:hypothetical protein|tara:strand:+ start:372 stop:701 length:330 start_codon:yes stop_codon:yes gene_type:complete
MSIVFTPKISFSFGSGKMEKRNVAPKGPTAVYWSTTELNNLVELRAIGLSYKDCAKLLGRSQTACISACDGNSLHSSIGKRRQKLINEVLDNDIKRKDSSITATITATA